MKQIGQLNNHVIRGLLKSDLVTYEQSCKRWAMAI